MKTIKIFILIFVITSFGACEQSENKVTEEPTVSSKESLVKVNRYLAKAEREDIEHYIKRHQLDMDQTGSGLYYIIYEEGNGEPVVKDKIVELEYELSLITGDVIYSSAANGTLVFKVGHGGVETGLEEALLLMKKGDKAKLIIPSHLAHGFMGDDDKIPPRSTVLYDINIINLK